ncbi:mucin TcMUCI, partial [Reticulomyxa filosa]
NVLVLTMDGVLTVFVGGLFSYALGVVVAGEWKETKGHGSGMSQVGLGLTQQASYQKKMNEKEEQLLSMLSPTTPKSYVFERNERAKQRTQYRDHALLKFYFTLAFIALAVTFILFIALFFAGVVQLLMYSVAVSVVCFSLMYNANWGLIPACCCCCLREPILTLQDFKKLDEQKQSHWKRKYESNPIDGSSISARACQNIPFLCKSRSQPDTTTTTTTTSAAKTTATTTSITTAVALVTDDEQNKEKEGSSNSEKELRLTTTSLKADKNQKGTLFFFERKNKQTCACN